MYRIWKRKHQSHCIGKVTFLVEGIVDEDVSINDSRESESRGICRDLSRGMDAGEDVPRDKVQKEGGSARR